MKLDIVYFVVERRNVDIHLPAFLAVVKHSLTFISRPKLHSVVSHLGVSTVRTLFIDLL
jgi:hypothetical protein